MTKMKRGFLWVLVGLNAMVLLGQVWPAGAPPFARWVNIGFLAVMLLCLLRAATAKG